VSEERHVADVHGVLRPRHHGVPDAYLRAVAAAAWLAGADQHGAVVVGDSEESSFARLATAGAGAKGAQSGPAHRIPQLQCALAAGRSQALAVRAERGTHDVAGVAAERQDEVAAGSIPQAGCLAGDGQMAAVRTERYRREHAVAGKAAQLAARGQLDQGHTPI